MILSQNLSLFLEVLKEYCQAIIQVAFKAYLMFFCESNRCFNTTEAKELLHFTTVRAMRLLKYLLKRISCSCVVTAIR